MDCGYGLVVSLKVADGQMPHHHHRPNDPMRAYMHGALYSACVRDDPYGNGSPHQLFFEALSFRALWSRGRGENERPQGTADAKANLKRQWWQ